MGLVPVSMTHSLRPLQGPGHVGACWPFHSSHSREQLGIVSSILPSLPPRLGFVVPREWLCSRWIFRSGCGRVVILPLKNQTLSPVVERFIGMRA